MKRLIALLLGGLCLVGVAGQAASDPHHEGHGGGGYAARGGDEHGGYAPRGGYGVERGPEPRAAYGYPRAPSGYGYPRGPAGYGAPGGYRPAPPAYSRYPSYEPHGAYPPARENSLGADWREQQEEARSGVRMGQMAPLTRVIEGIGRHAAGRPLDAGIEYRNGRPAYRVRWMTTRGRRVDYIVDAATGAILAEH